MTICHAIILTLFVNAFCAWGSPTLVPYDARNAQTRKATLALYKTAYPKIEEESFPLVLDENPTQQEMPQASILIDDNNKIIGLIIYFSTMTKNRRAIYINEFIVDKKNSGLAKDLIQAFEQEKKQERYDLITINVTKDNKNLFKSLDFKENTADKKSSLMGKYISEASSSSSSSSRK